MHLNQRLPRTAVYDLVQCDTKIVYRTINARAETVDRRPRSGELSHGTLSDSRRRILRMAKNRWTKAGVRHRHEKTPVHICRGSGKTGKIPNPQSGCELARFSQANLT